MKKLMTVFAILALAAFAMTAFASPKATTVTGWVSDMHCGTKHTKAGGEDCVKTCAKNGLALVTDSDSKVWKIDNPEIIQGQEGKHVKVTGTPDADKGTIHIDKIAMLEESSKKDDKKTK